MCALYDAEILIPTEWAPYGVEGDRGIPWRSQDSPDILGYAGIFWDILGCPGIPWDIPGYPGISKDILGYPGISLSRLPLHRGWDFFTICRAGAVVQISGDQWKLIDIHGNIWISMDTVSIEICK